VAQSRHYLAIGENHERLRMACVPTKTQPDISEIGTVIMTHSFRIASIFRIEVFCLPEYTVIYIVTALLPELGKYIVTCKAVTMQRQRDN
jgi:hypothetical protein